MDDSKVEIITAGNDEAVAYIRELSKDFDPCTASNIFNIKLSTVYMVLRTPVEKRVHLKPITVRKVLAVKANAYMKLKREATDITIRTMSAPDGFQNAQYKGKRRMAQVKEFPNALDKEYQSMFKL